jgi:hypothetical protein
MVVSLRIRRSPRAERLAISVMGALKRSLKVIALVVLLIVLVGACSIGIWLLWWYAPVSVKATHIVKSVDSDIGDADEARFCSMFSMTPDEFRAYWSDVRPIFEFELHEYSLGSCYFKATEGGREYTIGIGGVGMVTKGDTTYYYVRKSAKSDLIPDEADVK